MNKLLQRGFTLIELIIFIVIISVGIAGILSVMDTTVKSSADPMIQKQSLAIAESMLEEILHKEYANPSGGYSGTNRALFDDVGDYQGYTTSAGMVDMNGSATPGLSGYNLSPAITVTSSTDLTGINAKKITVSVTGPAGTFTLQGYRAEY